MTSSTAWSCALTGHRTLPLDFNENSLLNKLEELIEKGCKRFYCGMAQGFDLLSLKCLVHLKQRYDFSIEACIPYVGQERGYSSADRALYRELLKSCDERTVFFESYRDGCFLIRNRYMVDNADTVLAYCLKHTGGTAYTANYAIKKGVPVIFVR